MTLKRAPRIHFVKLPVLENTSGAENDSFDKSLQTLEVLVIDKGFEIAAATPFGGYVIYTLVPRRNSVL